MSYLKIVRHAGCADVLPIHRDRGITAGNIARALSRSECPDRTLRFIVERLYRFMYGIGDPHFPAPITGGDAP